MATVTDILAQIQKDIIVLMEREKYIKESIGEMSSELQQLREEISEMRNMANRWKGGFVVLAGLGGIVGWILSTWSSFSSIVGK